MPRELIVKKNSGMKNKIKQFLEIADTVKYYRFGYENSYRSLKYRIKKQYDVTILGAGYSAIVFDLEGKYAVRIEFCDRTKNTAKIGGGFQKWVEFAINNKINLCPKVFYHAEMINNNGVPFLITVTKKLTELEHSYLYEGAPYEEIKDHIDNLKKAFKTKSIKKQDIYLKKFEESLNEKLEKWLSVDEFMFIKENIKLNDIHSGNVMLDMKKKKVVFTDPIF